MKLNNHRWIWLMLAGFLLAACNFPGGATPTDPMAEVRTAAALTVQAMATQAAPTQTAPALPTLTPPRLPAPRPTRTSLATLLNSYPKAFRTEANSSPGRFLSKAGPCAMPGAVFGRQLTSSSTSPAISPTSSHSKSSPTARSRQGKRWSLCSALCCRRNRGITARISACGTRRVTRSASKILKRPFGQTWKW